MQMTDVASCVRVDRGCSVFACRLEPVRQSLKEHGCVDVVGYCVRDGWLWCMACQWAGGLHWFSIVASVSSQRRMRNGLFLLLGAGILERRSFAGVPDIQGLCTYLCRIMGRNFARRTTALVWLCRRWSDGGRCLRCVSSRWSSSKEIRLREPLSEWCGDLGPCNRCFHFHLFLVRQSGCRGDAAVDLQLVGFHRGTLCSGCP